MTPDVTAPAADPDYDAKLTAAAERVAGQVRQLIDPGQVVELRALRVQDGTKGGSTWAGTFTGDELPELCKAALNLSGNCSGVYFTLNPLKPARLALAAHRPRVGKVAGGQLAHDVDVLIRRWVLIDVDPVRAKGKEKDSATDAEKAAAHGVMQAVREYLAAGESDWPPPIVADSGNGYHLLYRLDDGPIDKLPLPEDDPLRQMLRHLAGQFNTAAATIDTSVFNPSRIVKFPGTLACKGSGEGDRPHRRARILEVPGCTS
jgi:hypothetical protein